MRSFLKIAVLTLLLPAGLQAQGGQVVGPGGTPLVGNTNPWNPMVSGGATIEVTTDKPREGWNGNNLGSLRMTVSGERRNLGGDKFDYPDWAFWYSYAGGSLNSNQSYGSLSSLSALSFDWFRTPTQGWDAGVGTGDQPINPADWRYKTPVVRLELRETRGDVVVYSELVWEGYFNKCKLGNDMTMGCDNNWTTVNQWVTQSGMQNDNFWYVNPTANGGVGSNPCNQQLTFWSGGVVSSNAGGLLGDCFNGVTVDIVGIAVGVGSQWPLAYEGFVDNVRMGFGGAALANYAVDANFDFVHPPTTVPEPSTYALMGIGLLALGVTARRRRKG